MTNATVVNRNITFGTYEINRLKKKFSLADKIRLIQFFDDLYT